MPVVSFSQTSSSRQRPSRLGAGLALGVFVACLAAGLILAGERAGKREVSARALARVTALARGAAIEAQFAQAVTATEALAAVARQNGNAIPNFQKLAADMLATWPGLASLEWQPGGMTSDIVPRAGHERAIGFNVFQDPLYRFGAYEALQTRAITVSGPLPLYSGMPGIVVRFALAQRGRDGRESFAGFVTVSMRLGDALSRARLDDLAAQGYDYSLFAPAPSGGKAVVLASRGVASAQTDVTLPVRIRNIELRLTLRPRNGWIDKSKIAVETAAMVAVSGLAGLVTLLFFSRWQVVKALGEAEQRIAAEAETGKQAREDGRRFQEAVAALEAELKIVKSSLQRAEFSNTELQASLEEEIRHGAAAREEAKARLNYAKQNAGELQSRLEASIRSADSESQARNAELEESRSMLEQALQRISEMQGLLEAASLVQTESTAKYKTQLQQDQTVIRDLQTRLDAALKARREPSVAETPAAPEAVPTPEPAAAETIPASDSAVAEAVPEPAPATFEPDPTPAPAAAENAPTPAPVEVETVPASTPATVEPIEPLAPSEEEAPPLPPEPEQAAPTAPEFIEEITPPTNEQSMKRHAPKATKHKHTENQLDLFGLGAVSNTVESTPSTLPGAAESVAATNPPIAAVPLPSVAALPEEPRQAAVEEPVKPEIHAGDGKEVSGGSEESPRAEARREDIAELFPELPATNAGLLRKAVKQILPLLADQDPGAVDCFEDNRAVFRTTFTREGFVEFERLVKTGDFAAALADLKKAAKKHGVTF